MKQYVFLILAFLLISCIKQKGDNNRHTEDTAAINQLREKEEIAAEAGNVDSLMVLRTEDFISMPPNQPAVKGKEAVREFLTGMFGQIDMEETLDSEDVTISGDLAFDRGTFKGTATPKTGGDSIPLEGKYLWILERQDDGSWKYAVQIWSENSPSSP